MAGKASDLFKQESTGVLESLKEGIQAVAPGLSLSKILHDVDAELKEQAAQQQDRLINMRLAEEVDQIVFARSIRSFATG